MAHSAIAARPDWGTAILLKAICFTHNNQREQAQRLTANLKAMSSNSIVEALPQSHPFVIEAVRQRYISGWLRSGLNPQLHRVADPTFSVDALRWRLLLVGQRGRQASRLQRWLACSLHTLFKIRCLVFLLAP